MDEPKTFTYQTRLEFSGLNFSILNGYGMLYGKIERTLFKALNDSLAINQLKSAYLVEFGITARQFNAIRVSVQGKIAAAKACRKEQIEQLKEKISALGKKS